MTLPGGSGSAAVSFGLPSMGNLRQSLSVNAERQGFKDDRTGYDRGHVLYRAATGGFHLDEPGDFGALLEVFVLPDEEAHPRRDQFDAVAQREPEQVGLVYGSLQRGQPGQRVERLHGAPTF